MIGQLPDGSPTVHLSILTASSYQFLPLARMTAANKLQYAMKWGFGINFGRHFERIYRMWGDRQVQMLCALHTCDWLWFLGVDTIITNMTIDARSFCDPEYHAVIARDVNGINNDSWFLKNCPETIEFTHRVLARRGKETNDQDAMKFVMADWPQFKMKVMPSQRSFNAYMYSRPEYAPYSEAQKQACGGEWEAGDFVLHFAGIDLPSRMLLTQQFLQAVITG